ncbi:hypothetical protein [Flavobacterium phage FCOV-S2]|nr:hypothetical protein [Flavobacterium phage FCOV-S1]QCW21804.1 hypothetical protein [Flavobacterium phage FCOV-S2]
MNTFGINATRRSATNNQSTVDYSVKSLFLFGNRYQTATFKNNTGAKATFKSGFLVLRDTTTPANVIPAIAGETLANVIGVLKLNNETTLANNETTPANYCISGDIDVNLLQLPDTVTLDTVVGTTGKCLRDFLTDLGFVLKNVTENSNFDN